MTWSLPHNLRTREAAIDACWPHATIYALGDAAHQAEHSDHNPDARGLVHAIDVMFAAGTPEAIATLAWALAWTDDLEYVIHDHLIYERSHGFRPIAYTGSDPHTNHIHISGRHGSVGKDAATGTGYDVAAEAMTPPGNPLEDDMALTDTDAGVVAAHKLSTGETLGGAIADAAVRTDAITNKQLPALAAAVAAIPTTALPPGPISDADVARIATAVVALLDARLAS